MTIAVTWFADTQVETFDGSCITNVAILAGKSSIAARASTFFNFDRARFTRVVLLGSVQRYEREPEIYAILPDKSKLFKVSPINFAFNFNLIKH